MASHLSEAPLSSFQEYENPAYALFRNKKPAVIRTRELLFSELRKASPEASRIIEDFFLEAQKSFLLPSVGEMLPWVIGDLADADKVKLNDVAVGWLGLYIYGILLDHKADCGQALTAQEQLASALLYSFALRRLQRAVGGTAYEQIFYDHLSIAVRGQLTDIQSKSDRSVLDREQYSTQKNSSFVCAAVAVAAITPKQGKTLVAFTEEFRLPAQFLDDIADWVEDAHSNTHTQLLADAMHFNRVVHGDARALTDLTQDELMILLIESGSLLRVLRKIEGFFENKQVITLLGKTSASSAYFLSLVEAIRLISKEAEIAREKMNRLNEEERKALARHVSRSLRVVAQST